MSDPGGAALRRLWRQLSPRRRRQLFVVLGMMLAGAVAEVVSLGAVLPFLAALANPSAVMRVPVVATVVAGLGLTEPSELPIFFTVVFAVAVVLAGAVRVAILWVSNRYIFMLGHDLGTKLYQRVLYQPYSWHVARNTSEVIAAVQKVQAVTGGTLMPLIQLVTATLISAFVVAAMLIVNPIVSFAAFAGVGLLYGGVSVFSRRTLGANGRTIVRIQRQQIQAVQEGVGGIRDVLLDGSQPVFFGRFAKLDSELRQAQAANALIGAAPRYVIEAAGMMLIASLAYLLAASTGGFAAAVPVLGALALGAQRLLPLMQLAYASWTQMAGNKQALFDVLDMLEAPLPADLSDPPPLAFENEVVLRDISFSYGEEHAPVLTKVNLVIPKGARVGIAGKTGSGKSTLVDLLMGLLEPTAGCIEVDGQQLDALTRRAWQRNIAHVPQSIFLADASIAENIAFGMDPRLIDAELIESSARQAQIADFVEALPNGYATMVGERGVRLSGGQRQRIGIARALYKQAQVLIFDEATSALDYATESSVMQAIRQLDRMLTVIIIAHRVTTLDMCDFVIEIRASGADLREVA